MEYIIGGWAEFGIGWAMLIFVLLSFILNIYIVFRIIGFSMEEKYLKAAVERLR